jgi:hypothetical protein
LLPTQPHFVHAILTLACLCRALRLTRPSHRLPSPALSLGLCIHFCFAARGIHARVWCARQCQA